MLMLSSLGLLLVMRTTWLLLLELGFDVKFVRIVIGGGESI